MGWVGTGCYCLIGGISGPLCLGFMLFWSTVVWRNSIKYSASSKLLPDFLWQVLFSYVIFFRLGGRIDLCKSAYKDSKEVYFSQAMGWQLVGNPSGWKLYMFFGKRFLLRVRFLSIGWQLKCSVFFCHMMTLKTKRALRGSENDTRSNMSLSLREPFLGQSIKQILYEGRLRNQVRTGSTNTSLQIGGTALLKLTVSCWPFCHLSYHVQLFMHFLTLTFLFQLNRLSG